MRSLFTLILLAMLMPLSMIAQATADNNTDLTGLWTGTLYNDSSHTYSNYEIAITKEKEKLTGFSHTWFMVDGKQYYGVKKVVVKKAPDGKIIIVDAELVAKDYPDDSRYIRQLNVLTLSITDKGILLEGPFATNRSKAYQAVTGMVKLQKNNVLLQSALWPHLQQMGREKDFSFIGVAMH